MDSDNSDESSESREEEEWLVEVEWLEKLRRIKENDTRATRLRASNDDDVAHLQNMTDEDWEELGRDISNNTHLETVALYGGDMNDQSITSLFRELTGSRSINDLELYENGLSIAGVRSMVPFLQNANNLTRLDLDNNNIRSEGFNVLFRALRDSPIEKLTCDNCNIESIEIDCEHMPQNLTTLQFDRNSINSDGCRQIAKLLKGGNATLQLLSLEDNEIDDVGVEVLVDALKNNTSLKHIHLRKNDKINHGIISFLRLVCDISSINATLQSNHTLQSICVVEMNVEGTSLNDRFIQVIIDDAVRINKEFRNNPDRVGKEKIIQTQLKSGKRKMLEVWQGVSSSLYSEIDPLHLPEVLALVGRRHRPGELYIALKSSIAGVISTVNRRECIKQQRAYHATKLKELDAELAAMDEAEREAVGVVRDESRSSKRRRE